MVRRGWMGSAARAALAAAMLSGAAAAQTARPAGGPVEGETIVVVGQTIEETLPQELERYGSDLEVVTSDEVRDLVLVDAGQALQMRVPGLFLAPRGGPFSYLDISLQGSRTQDMLFLVDGVRVNNRLYSTTVTDTLPAAMIERIEVLKGGQSLFYGTQAAAGVINVVTRGYTDELDGRVTVGLDTNEGHHADAYVRGPLGPGNFVLYASQDKAEGFTTFTRSEPSATDKDRSYDVDSIGAKYRVELGDRLSLDGRYQHTDAALDYPAATRTAFSENVRDEDVASLGLEYRPADWADVLVKGYWHDWDSTYTTINNTVGPGGAITGRAVVDLGTYWGYEDKGINALAKLRPHRGIEYAVGYDFQQYSGRDDVLLIAEQEEEVHAVFGQLRTTEDLIENGAFAAGLRYNETGDTSATVWNVSGRYDVLPALYVQANAGTSFLLPTAEQLYAVDPFSTLGRADIEPEESENLNVSVGGDPMLGGTQASWQATYFARNIENLIGFADFASPAEFAALYPDLQTDPDPSTPQNEFFENGYYTNVPGQVEVRGFELLGAVEFGAGFGVTASYTHTDTKMDGSANQLARIPEDFAKLAASYEAPSQRWGADASVLWTGDQTANVNSFGLVNYGDYTVVDLAAHVFLDAGAQHKLTVRLENAFDEDYVTRPNSAAPDAGGARFFFGNRGVPQTLRVTYSYDF
jgi:outer membrane cobalamin receptor